MIAMLKSWRTIPWAVCIIAASVVGMKTVNMISDYNESKREVVRLKIENSNLESQIEGVNTQLEQARRAFVIAEEERTKIAQRLRALQQIEDNIDARDPNDDGEIAPVLRDTLDSLRDLDRL